MKNWALLILFIGILGATGAQTRLDSTLVFKKKSKNFSVYLPSGAIEGEKLPMMVALHPFNTKRWNAQAWCDTLVQFAEQNQLVLLCPDGGEDGKVDDQIDTSFTTQLLRGAANWLPVDPNKYYLMGFSWGGRTTYSYGMQHVAEFKGYIAIGAAFGRNDKYPPGFAKVVDKPFYLLHGEQDAPELRLFPLSDSLRQSGAYVQTTMLKGVGHTIDLEDRDVQLSKAYRWVDSVASNLTDTTAVAASLNAGLQTEFPEKVKSGTVIPIEYLFRQPGDFTFIITDLSGKTLATKTMKVGKGRRKFKVSTDDLPWGVYLIKIIGPQNQEMHKFMVRG
ncbi:MAG: hypothetical protein ACFB10_20460 [Salibacteraceae bacterium]